MVGECGLGRSYDHIKPSDLHVYILKACVASTTIMLKRELKTLVTQVFNKIGASGDKIKS